jgi:RIO kinase 1
VTNNHLYGEDYDNLDKYDHYASQFDPILTDRQARRKRKPKVKHNPKKAANEVLAEVGPATGIEGGEFTTSYTPARFEKGWLLEAVRTFYLDEQISDILFQIKGGKEASVYCCQAHSSLGIDLLAVKVYRPRMFRNLRNDAMYRQGRSLLATDGRPVKERDQRLERAVKKKTAFGAQAQHTSWLMYEFNAMARLYAAGATVPEPIASAENAILMTYLGDDAIAAPILHSVSLEYQEAKRLFDKTMDNINLMLQHNMIHGDLSAYNILYWDNDITLIDFPQVVNSRGNPDAYFILQRDITRVCEYFSGQGIDSDPEAITAGFWQTFLELDPEDKAADESMRDYQDWVTLEDELEQDD